MSCWYEGGLRFQCTQCGNCCTGSPGYVWVHPREESAIAEFLGLSRRAFRKRYTRLVGQLLSLVERPGGDCVFLTEDRRCAIQPVKPRQCLAFPFWPRLTASRRNWRETAQGCPGIGQGALFTREEIDRIQDPDTPRRRLCEILASKRRRR